MDFAARIARIEAQLLAREARLQPFSPRTSPDLFVLLEDLPARASARALRTNFSVASGSPVATPIGDTVDPDDDDVVTVYEIAFLDAAESRVVAAGSEIWGAWIRDNERVWQLCIVQCPCEALIEPEV